MIRPIREIRVIRVIRLIRVIRVIRLIRVHVRLSHTNISRLGLSHTPHQQTGSMIGSLTQTSRTGSVTTFVFLAGGACKGDKAD